MSAFSGIRIPEPLWTGGSFEKEAPGPALYPGNYNWECSNTVYVYPYGRKVRNMFFVGPFELKDQSLIWSC